MSDHSLALELENSLDSILVATRHVSMWLEEVAAPAECQELAAITLEEIVLNCIKYGYDDDERHTIEVSWELRNDQFRMTIRDDGHPFNPLEAPPPNLSDNLEDRPIGGLGIYLLRQLWSDIEYRRQDGRNCLTLTKSLVDAALN
ncbi:MAG: hypothetical protein RIS70_2147 [Planctomycetota bacterium]|jgi:anti-sigma regulatory factor (Ser/Thr protein kinase)